MAQFHLSTTGLSRILDPIADCFTPEVAKHILELSTDDAVRSRIEELASKSNEGELSSEEADEYESYIRAMDVVAVLKAKARSIAIESTGS